LITEDLRNWCADIRRRPTPLDRAILMVQRAADEIDRLNAVIAEKDAAIAQLQTDLADGSYGGTA
jgi:hypothetical protein